MFGPRNCEVDDFHQSDKQRISRRLWLMVRRIEVVQRESEIYTVEKIKVLRRQRPPRGKQNQKNNNSECRGCSARYLEFQT